MIDEATLRLGAKAHQELLDDFSQRYAMRCVAQSDKHPGERMTSDAMTTHIIGEMRSEFGRAFEAPPCQIVWDLFLESIQAQGD